MDVSSKWQEFKASMNPKVKEWKFMLKRTKESPLSVVGIAIIVMFVVIALLAPVIAPPTKRDPFRIPQDYKILNLTPNPVPPTAEHPFGTTDQQYDVYYTCIWGTITAFRVGLTVIVIALILGILIGVTSAYYGGVADEVLMRFTDIIIAFPGLILAMAVVIAFPTIFTVNLSLIITVILGLITLFAFASRTRMHGAFYVLLLQNFVVALLSTIYFPWTMNLSITNLDKILITLAVIGWPSYARVMRGEVLRVKNEDYIEAAKAAGCSDFRIMIKHILPNAIYPIIIMASLDTGSVVLTAAALSFLGIGAPIWYADWGQIISRARPWITAGESIMSYAHIFLLPGIFIFTFVLGWNLLGDAFRDVLDPTLRRR